MKKLLLVAAALPFVAAAQQEPQAFSISECYRALWAESKAQPVADRIGMGQTPIPLPLRASKLKANAKEKESLTFVADGLQNCQRLDAPNRERFHPLTRQMVDEFEAGHRSNLAKAYAGDLTWGALIEANEANLAAFTRRNAELTAMGEAQRTQQAQAEKQAAEAKKIAAEAEYQRRAALRADFERQQRQEEIARQEQANRDIANGLLMLQMARPQPAINCRSTRFFDTVNTTCN